MNLFPLEVGNLDGLFILILLIMFGPAILLLIIGTVLITNKKKKAGKIMVILAGIYALVSLGICGSMMI